MGFRPLSDSQLERLGDEELAAYVAEAFAARSDASARRALAILTWGYEPWIERQVSKKVPTEHVHTVVDAIIESAGVAALEGKPTFAGATEREYRRWLTTIIKRRIADFWRSPIQGVVTIRLAEDVGDDEGCRGAQLIQRDAAERLLARFEVEDALARLRPDHAEAMRLIELAGYTADHAAQQIPGMTAANVYKIRERFRREFAAGEPST